ncbi:MAG: FimB/Mfa2 family fimbrial subunit [Bacteroidales bacterium]
MLFKKLSILFFLTSLWILMMPGCTKEDMTDCFSGLRLRFNFTLHNNGGSLFGEEVNRVRVYLFDEQEILQLYVLDDGRTIEYSYVENGRLKTISKPNLAGKLPEGYIMELNVAPGRYKVVAWGGSAKDKESTFFHGHMKDPVTHDFIDSIIIGETTMSDFRMFLKYKVAPELPEDIIPIVSEIDDLWYGACGTRNPTTSKYIMKDVIVRNGEITDELIDLIKNTNILKVTISGYENKLVSDVYTRINSPLKVWTTAVNGRYKIDNSIGEAGRSIRYTPHFENIDFNKMIVDIKILRIDMERHTAQPMYLTIEDPVTGKKFPEEPIDIVNTLMQARDYKGNYIYNNQADFDQEYEHPIEVKIDLDLTVRIFVRGWKIVHISPET